MHALCAVSKLAACHVQTQAHMLGVTDINVCDDYRRRQHHSLLLVASLTLHWHVLCMQHYNRPFYINFLPMCSLSQAAFTLLQRDGCVTSGAAMLPCTTTSSSCSALSSARDLCGQGSSCSGRFVVHLLSMA